MTNVVVPVELTDEETEEIRAAVEKKFAGCCGDAFCESECPNSSLCDISVEHLSVVCSAIAEHFQAHPEVSDAEKGYDFYRAVAGRLEPEWMPARVQLVISIRRYGETIGPGAYRVDSFQGDVLFIIHENGRAALYPHQYEVLEWRKNEADK
jgi:hypothetical protein